VRKRGRETGESASERERERKGEEEREREREEGGHGMFFIFQGNLRFPPFSFEDVPTKSLPCCQPTHVTFGGLGVDQILNSKKKL
jgi:hypothetical protein